LLILKKAQGEVSAVIRLYDQRDEIFYTL
jgi:hypothetical protein